MTEYQSNSKKSKEEQEIPAKLEPVVTGPVIQKERSMPSRLKNIFFGGDFKSSAANVGGNVLLPALRQLMFDVVVEGVRGVMFGESGYRRRGPIDLGSRVQYNTVSQLPRRDMREPRVISPTTTRIPDQKPYQAGMPRRQMNQIILYSRNEAENVLERLTDALDKYQTVSVADLYQLLELESTPIDHKWGWTFLHNTEIRQVREGFLLDLPPIEVL